MLTNSCDVVCLINDHHVPFKAADDFSRYRIIRKQADRSDNQRVFRKFCLDIGVFQSLGIEQRECQVKASLHFNKPLVRQCLGHQYQDAAYPLPM